MPASRPTEAEVGRIIDGEKGISGNIVWEHTPNHDAAWAKFKVIVENDGGWKLILYGNAQLAAPDNLPKRSYSLVLRRDAQNFRVFALDVNGSHRNKTADHKRWNHQTHKQRWDDTYADEIAYTPDESIPEEPNDAFLEFCGECNIVFTGQIGNAPTVNPA